MLQAKTIPTTKFTTKSFLNLNRTASEIYQPQGKIVGGFPVNVTQVPWQASIRVWNGKKHVCGGSIIGKRWILTASHCLRPFMEYDIRVRVGATHVNEGGQLFDVQKIHFLPGTNILTDWDFGLIVLKTEMEYNDKVQPIALPNFGDAPVADGTLCLVTGWGKTLNPSEPSDTLRAAEIPIVNQKACAKAYAPNRLTPRMMCAGLDEGGKGGML